MRVPGHGWVNAVVGLSSILWKLLCYKTTSPFSVSSHSFSCHIMSSVVVSHSRKALSKQQHHDRVWASPDVGEINFCCVQATEFIEV